MTLKDGSGSQQRAGSGTGKKLSLNASEWVPSPSKGAASVGDVTTAGAAHAHAHAQQLQNQNVRFDSSNPLYKTELCRSFEEFGQCRYGNKCQFAHSLEELRPVQRHPKYKTEVCKTFATTGTCPYGTRCRFIHQTQTLARLQTAKVQSGVGESARDDASVYSASMSGMSTPVPMSPHSSIAVPHGNVLGVDMLAAPDVNDNPLSFANVAKGAAKINKGSSASMARVASGLSGINGASGVPSSNGGSLVGSVVGSPPMSNYLDAVKERQRANGGMPATAAISINGNTALAAALDVLAVEDDVSDLADSLAGSLAGSLPKSSMFGSLEGRKSFLSDLGNRPAAELDLDLGLDESILGTSADISGSSLMSHMGNKDRRLPIFSKLRGPEVEDGGEPKN